MKLREPWILLDGWVERAVLGRLPAGEARLLDALLALAAASGLALGLWHPPTLTLALLTPVVMASFFKGFRVAGWLLLPAAAVSATVDPSPLGIATFLGGGGLGILWASVTVGKYRQARLRGEELGRALAMARQVQRGLEPPGSLRWGPLAVAARFETCEFLGGDFVCLRDLGPGRFGIVVGDVMGHGVQAALAAAFVTGLYGELARSGLGPAPVLQAINRRFCEFFGPHDCFVTLAALEYDTAGEQWRIALAGQEPPLLARADGTCERLPEVQGLPAGIDPLEEYREIRRPSRPGDHLLLASDGLAPEGLPEGPTLATLRDSREQPVEEALGRLFDLLGRERLRDDASGLLIRREA